MSRNLISPPFVSRRQALAFLGTAAAYSSLTASSLLLADEIPSGQRQLVVRSDSPFNAEPVLSKLVKEWITPEQYFYVRNHGTLPKVDAAAFRLSVTGLVDRPVSLSLAELQAIGDSLTIPATLTCAGNRRQEFAKTKAVGGVQWDAGAIGNARWTGLRLSSLLAKCGVKAEAKHIWFEGLDACKHDTITTPFGASIPLERALAEKPVPALLAWKMNGEDLSPDHGFPLRGLVPGFIGARSVKWLAKIVVSDRPSPNYFQAVAYKLIEKESEAVTAAPIYEFLINSAICDPILAGGGGGSVPKTIAVSGYALPQGAASKLGKVEVSADGGKNWKLMKLLDDDHPGCWRRFAGEISLPDISKSIVVRATDFQGATQLKDAKWNMKGYQYNGWHEVPVARPM